MPRPVLYIILAVIVIWAISAPASAGSQVHDWVTGIISFIQHLVRG